MIEIRHFQLIKMISEAGSMTKASEKLFLTQPTLSHQLKEIESKLGASLFLRINKKLILTEEGKKIIEAAHEILPRIAQIENDIKGIRRKVKHLRLTTQCYTCYHWLPEIMKKFQTEFPTTEIDIVTEAMSNPVDYLLKGEIDLAITNNLKRQSGIKFEKLFEDEQVALVPSRHPLAARPYLRPSDFKNESLIIYKEDINKDYFAQNVLIPRSIPIGHVTKMQLTEARVELVKAGMGLTVLSKWLVKPFVRDTSLIKLIPIGKNGFYRTWYTGTLQSRQNEPGLKQFISFLRDQELGS
ncbi:MAG TPA: LysR family transcriptional regulator [Saprospiraceae bacterium]|nr:LysR family transcriptional regulator [Saprospiraceae bacterium]HNT19892.1 LysR family transcriptional regulator [Saprospiraceae bacterium]